MPVPAAQWLPVASVPALVSEEEFARVQAKLGQNRAFARRPNTVHAYLLRALVSCGLCRSGCLCRTIHPGYAYYVCRGKGDPLHSHRDEPCRARYAPAHQLDALVWRDLCELLTHPEHVARALARAHGGGWLPQELQARREQLRQARLTLERQLERLTEAYLLAVIPLPEYQRRRQTLEQRLHALDAQAGRLEAQVDRQAELAGWAASAADFCGRVRAGLAGADFARKRQLVELLIDRVLVTDGEVEIRYVIPLSPGSEKVRFCHLRKDYFDLVAVHVDPRRTTDGRLALLGRDGRPCPHCPDLLAQPVRGEALVAHDPHRLARQLPQQARRDGRLVRLAGCQGEGDGPSARVRHRYGLGAIAATRAPKRFTLVPACCRSPFLGAPAALACARMLVPSRNAMHSSTPPARAWASASRRSHTPCLAQRMNVCAAPHQGPSSAGMARHLAPFWCRHRMAAIVRRRSAWGVLPRGRTASTRGSRTAHCASVRT